MNKLTAYLGIFLVFIAASSFSQVGKYKPFTLVIISPDTAIIDTVIKSFKDTLEHRYLRAYYDQIKQMKDRINKNHTRDSAFRRIYIQEEAGMIARLKAEKKLENQAKSFKYYQTISEYSEYVYEYYFNEFPPYSNIISIPKTKLTLQNLSHIADSLKADYIIGFKNIRTERQNGTLILKLTSILYSRKGNIITHEQQSSGDAHRNLSEMWTCLNPLSCLLISTVKSSSDIIFEILNKRQSVNRKLSSDGKGSYPLLNKTLDLLKQQNNYKEEELDTLLIGKIDSVFQFGLKVSKTNDELKVHYNGKKFNLNDRKDLIKICNYFRPSIEVILTSQHFETDYDYYLADLIVFSINYMSCVTSREVGGYHNNCIDITIDKKGKFVIYDNCYDLDHNTLNSGSIITELNNTPIRYFTRGTLSNFLFKNRNGLISIKLHGDLLPRYVRLRNCDIRKANGLVYKLDLNGNCYINFNSYIEDKVSNILHELLTADCDSIKNIIVDLRNNRGGSMKETLELVNLFLKPGLVLVELIKKGLDTSIYISLNYNLCEGKPMYVFINGITTGSGDVIAGILREYRGAKLIGDKTMGNVKMQVTYNLSDNYYINIFDGNIRIAKKYMLSDDSILPDISFDSSEYDDLKLNDFR